jgi:uncharacterized damage-inducible protein DinB
MTETERIADQLKRSHEGVAWHGPSLRELLHGITAEQAARKTGEAHSIWELVLHIAAWELAGARMVQGEVVGDLTPDQDWPSVGEPAELRWSETIGKLDAAHAELAEAIRQCAPERLSETAPGKKYSIYFLLHGIVQHNLYHAGQIAILRKLAPPAVEPLQHLA